jgi:hypothetical protein
VNVGLGPAEIESYKFRLDPVGKYNLTFHGLIEKLAELGLKLDSDYFLNNITKGYTVAQKEPLIIFEASLYKLDTLRCFDIEIRFKGYLGNKYIKEIYCIPRKGIPV